MATATETAPPPVVPEKAKVETPPAAVTPAVVTPPVPAAVTPPVVEAPKSLLAEPIKPETKPGDPPVIETPPVAPVEWKLEAPKDSGLTAEHIKSVEDFAKPLGMTPAQAQEIIKRDVAAQAQIATARQASLVKANDTWKAEATAKFGARLPEVVDGTLRALRVYDKTGAVTKLLKETAMGSNPDVLEFLSQIGGGLKEDAPSGGNASAPKVADPVQRFYGKDHTVPRTNR